MPEDRLDLLILTAAPPAPAPDGDGGMPTDDALPPAQRTVVLEPDPACARALAAARPDLEVIAAALAASPGDGALAIYNLPGLRALAPPCAALTDLFPGLQQTARRRVTCIDVAGLLDRLGPLPARVALDLDAPGQEPAILDALAAAGVLDTLAALTLRTGTEPLFEGAEPAAALIARIEAAGLRAAPASCVTDPDRPVLRFVADPVARALRSRAETAENRAETAETRAETAEARAEAAETRVEALSARLAEAGRAAEALETRGSAAERAAAEQTALREAAEARLAETQARLAEAEAAHEALGAAQAEAATLRAARDAAQATLEARAAALKQAQEARAEAEKAASRARDDLAVALRMQDLAQGDLAALRTAYAEADAARMRQADLLAALADRLRVAVEEAAPPEGPAPDRVQTVAQDTGQKTARNAGWQAALAAPGPGGALVGSPVPSPEDPLASNAPETGPATVPDPSRGQSQGDWIPPDRTPGSPARPAGASATPCLSGPRARPGVGARATAARCKTTAARRKSGAPKAPHGQPAGSRTGARSPRRGDGVVR